MFSLKIALALGCVLLDQRLEAGIFAQRVPLWIEFENRDRDAVWNFNQMIEQAKCFIKLPSPGINFGQRGSGLRPIKSVLRFR